MGMGINMSTSKDLCTEDGPLISLRPNYNSDNLYNICSEKMKSIYNQKFVHNEEQYNIPDILLDCEYMNEMIHDEIPTEWEKISLEDMVSYVYTTNVVVSHSDMDEFFTEIFTDLKFEDDEYETEEETES